ncbi:MAG: MarR family transcriptional regulator [Lawsonibacter sp.]|nr:MarR family transcriptional regulator [Lawsonibacter sp.]
MEKLRGCGLLIKQIHDELRKNANNALRSQDITLVQLAALEALNQATEGQCSLKELEQVLYVAQSTAAGIIARLEQKGFVEGFGDVEDRRIKRVRITTAGLTCLQTALHCRFDAEEQLLSGLTETERDIFYSLLKKVRDSL